jgi:lipopolysaccharide/colanic/teichoic acid biosynthesis glycosyltransferase
MSVARITKRLIDLVLSVLLLLLLTPFIIVCALLIKLQDGGPSFYRRRVVGLNGDFDAFKLRTMCMNADAILQKDENLRREYEQKIKIRKDPRVTPLGSFLRKSSLDELPQLFNVLTGQMSLVGPRMITAPELEKYGEHKELLLSVKPGLTGYWQINGRQEVSYEERVRMDVHYIRNWSLRMDCELLLLTPFRVIRGRGAY